MSQQFRGLNILQRISMSLMGILVLITFVGSNLHTLLWQSSDWLVSAVLPSTVVSLTNEERADNSVKPLARSAILDRAAKMKAEDMAKNQYFAHFSPTGVSPWYWFDQSGYVYAHAGENLAIHFTDSSEVIEAWMHSPKHRENIVSGLYTEIGVGTAKGKFDGYDTVYVVQLFGAPAYVPSSKVTSKPLTTATPNEVLVTKSEIVEVTEVQALEDLLGLTTQVVQESADLVQIGVKEEGLTAGELVATQSTVDFEEPKTINNDFDSPEVVVVESSPITTSSGLPAADSLNTYGNHAGETLASIATQPNTLLQLVYMVLAVLIVSMLSISIIVEARRFHFHQVAYGLILLVGMSGLWYAHSLLTTGAVIV